MKLPLEQVHHTRSGDARAGAVRARLTTGAQAPTRVAGYFCQQSAQCVLLAAMRLSVVAAPGMERLLRWTLVRFVGAFVGVVLSLIGATAAVITIGQFVGFL